MFPDLEGKVIVVAGGSGGIGYAVMRALLDSGARAYDLDRDAPQALEAREPVSFLSCDVRDAASVDASIQKIMDREHRLDGLVYAAGVTRDRTLHRMSEDEWETVLDVNLTGAFHVLRVAGRIMRGQGSGSIVTISSINGLRGKLGQANYSASKAGLIALTRTAARELGVHGVRVNAVAPGMVRTRMTGSLPPSILEEACRQSALGRLADPDDVAGPILFLLSDLARHMTGHVLVVDGGQTA